MIKLQSTFEGSIFPSWGVALSSVIDGVETPVSLVGANVVMNMTKDGDVYESYSTDAGTLTVQDNKVIIPEMVVKLYAGVYLFDFNVILANTKPLTGLAQGQWEILTPKTIR